MYGQCPPEVAILHAPGTNRDRDLADAFALAGARPTIHLIEALADGVQAISNARVVAIPGGYAYGDALGAGRLFSLAVETRLGDALREHIARGRVIVGICNGFQMLLRSGLLTDDAPGETPRATLGPNVGGHFVCGWTTIVADAESTSPVISAFRDHQPSIECPVAHGEGRFFAPDAATLDAFEARGQVAFRYAPRASGLGAWLGNPNGSDRDIAGITNAAGTVLGLMPHPENHVRVRQHPAGTRGSVGTSGLPFFRALLQQAA